MHFHCTSGEQVGESSSWDLGWQGKQNSMR